MPNLKMPVLLSGDKDKVNASALVDTGASFSFVTRSVAEKIGTITMMPTPQKFTLGNGGMIVINEQVTLEMQIEGLLIADNFMVIDQAPDEVILGLATMNKYRLRIDPARETLYAVLTTTDTPTPNMEEQTMSEKLKATCAKLGIIVSEGMTEDAALAAIEAKIATPPPAAKPASLAVLKELELPESATEAEIAGKIVALKHPGNVVSAEVHNAVLAQLKAQEVKSAVQTALQEGKIAPSELPWCEAMAKEDLPKFSAFIATRGKVVPIATKLPEQEQKHQAKVGDEELAIFAQLGVTVEQVVKANPQAA